MYAEGTQTRVTIHWPAPPVSLCLATWFGIQRVAKAAGSGRTGVKLLTAVGAGVPAHPAQSLLDCNLQSVGKLGLQRCVVCRG